MSGTKTDDKPDPKVAELEARHKKDVAAYKAEVEASKPKDVPPFHDEGYDVTRPLQTEIIAGSVEQERLLNAYPNVTSYAGTVNVIVAPEPPEAEPKHDDAKPAPKADTKHDDPYAPASKK